MDRRYVKLIADNFPHPQNTKSNRITGICLLALVPAFILAVNEYYSIYGVITGLLACSGMILSGIMSLKHRKKQVKLFMENYEKTGRLPEWPEDIVKNESPQHNN